MRKRYMVIIIVSFMLLSGCSMNQPDEYAIVMFMMGEVTKNNVPVMIGDLLNQNDMLKTGKNSFCDIQIGGSIIRVKEDSKMVFSELLHKGNVETTTLGLDVGKMLCKPKRLLKSEKFVVKTPTAVAAVRGTQFIVEVGSNETTAIKVFSGKIKIARRLKQLEGSIDKILEIAPEIKDHEKVVITKNDVEKAGKEVSRILEKETAKGEEKAIAIAIEQARNSIILTDKNSMKFNSEEIAKEKDEMVRVKERPREVIRQIVKMIEQEKELPRPQGRLLITNYEVYFIQGGKVLWEGKVVNQPLKWRARLYIASENYVFCASEDGPIKWRINMPNDGKLEIRDNKLVVNSLGNENFLDLGTGQQL